MHNNKHLIPRDELEPLLSEYATGMLDKGLKARVEESLRLYPDLQHEVDAIRGAFQRVNRESHNAAIDYETRNLSVHVVNALSQPRRNTLRHLVWLAPAVAVGIILVMINVGGPAEQTPLAGNRPQLKVEQSVSGTVDAVPVPSNDTVVDAAPKRTVVRTAPARRAEPVETIVDDLVVDQIVNRMASENNDGSEASVTGITDREIDVLLAAVASNESL